jgi:hypothetical protein
LPPPKSRSYGQAPARAVRELERTAALSRSPSARLFARRAPLAHLVERRTFNPVGRVRVPHGAFRKACIEADSGRHLRSALSIWSPFGPEIAQQYCSRPRYDGARAKGAWRVDRPRAHGEGQATHAGDGGGHLYGLARTFAPVSGGQDMFALPHGPSKLRSARRRLPVVLYTTLELADQTPAPVGVAARASAL